MLGELQIYSNRSKLAKEEIENYEFCHMDKTIELRMSLNDGTTCRSCLIQSPDNKMRRKSCPPINLFSDWLTLLLNYDRHPVSGQDALQTYLYTFLITHQTQGHH